MAVPLFTFPYFIIGTLSSPSSFPFILTCWTPLAAALLLPLSFFSLSPLFFFPSEKKEKKTPHLFDLHSKKEKKWRRLQFLFVFHHPTRIKFLLTNIQIKYLVFFLCVTFLFFRVKSPHEKLRKKKKIEGAAAGGVPVGVGRLGVFLPSRKERGERTAWGKQSGGAALTASRVIEMRRLDCASRLHFAP